jgi:hypothetical protein
MLSNSKGTKRLCSASCSIVFTFCGSSQAYMPHAMNTHLCIQGPEPHDFASFTIQSLAVRDSSYPNPSSTGETRPQYFVQSIA